MGGIECCRLWRQIEGPRKHIPIIGLTADSTEDTEKKCLDAGMDLRMTKPIEATELIEVIASQTVNNAAQTEVQTGSDPLGVVSNIKDRGRQAKAPAVDPAQLEYLLSIGDENFVQSIIDSYLEDTSDIMTAFRQSIDDDSVEDFRFHAHAFKSGASNIGANSLVETCSRLEVITEQDFASRKLEYLSKIERQVTDIRAYLQTVSTDSHDNISAGKAALV
jgi:two-component system sensor histidine kinase RpfC